MKLEYVPLLGIQRELQGFPRGMERFRQYLRTIQNEEGTGLDLPPLGIMNPMAKDHVTVLLDAYIALGADEITARVLAEAAESMADEPGDFKVGLVVADDLMGGWTNRYSYEFNIRFGFPGGSKRPKWMNASWLTAVLWSSEPATERAVRESILCTLERLVYVRRHGVARTLGDMLAQEGEVMAMVGCAGPVLDPEDIEYTREVLAPFLAADDMRTAIECLFGDAAGRTLGFTPRGLSPWAGIALALRDAREKREG